MAEVVVVLMALAVGVRLAWRTLAATLVGTAAHRDARRRNGQ